MPKYLIIGLAIPIIIFLTMNYWSKITELTKKRILLVIFGIFLISIFVLLIFIDELMDKGTKFQQKVWKYLMKIPKGKVKSYKEVAIGIKMPKSARAVANACGKNPYAPKVPCHRVIRSDGTLGGFSASGGIKLKKKLLKKEGFSF